MRRLRQGAEQTAIDGIREFVELQEAMVTGIHRDHHVNIEIAKRVRSSILFDSDEIDVPGVAALGSAVYDGCVRTSMSRPAWVRETHTEVEQDERALETRTAGPGFERWRQLEINVMRGGYAEARLAGPFPGARIGEAAAYDKQAASPGDVRTPSGNATLTIAAGAAARWQSRVDRGDQ